VRLTRVYVDAPLASGQRVNLPPGAAAHLTRVLRLGRGDALTVFNGQGGEYPAEIVAVNGGQVTIALGEHRALERESPLAITLAQGISRGERMDLVLQKATELGVAQLVPLLTERSVVRLDALKSQRKLNHWRAIAVAACEQSGRNHLPQIAAPVALADFLRAAREAPEHDGGLTRVLLSPDAARGIEQIEARPSALTVLIGPEGGFTEEEQAQALAGGFAAVRFGPRVLRTETAAIAALALLQGRFGDL
jgi:16S rRNA (uracil1498-N3)-methyltransferase